MAKIKPTHCKCSNQYIDFDNRIGCCPECSPDKEFAQIQQDVLKNLTYLDTDAAFKQVLNIVASEVKQRRTSEPTPMVGDLRPAPEPKKGFFKRLFRR